MNETTDSRYPDIEIYLHDTGPEQILDWLQQRFSSVSPDRLSGGHATHHLELVSDGTKFRATIVPRIPGRFTCLSFDSPATPWATDRECAHEAFDHFGVEIRCCADSWQPGREPDEWLRIDARGESLITWRN